MSDDKNGEARLVQSFLTLRGFSLRHVQEFTGIPRRNMRAWLAGTRDAITPSQKHALSHLLGVSRAGLSGRQVHMWTLADKRGKTTENYAPLETVLPLLRGARLAVFEAGGKRQVIYGMMGTNNEGKVFRVLLYLQHGLFARKSLVNPEYLSGVTWNGDGKLANIQVPVALRQPTLGAELTPEEFDMLMFNRFDNRNWQDVELVARARGVTPEAIIAWITARDRAVDRETPQRAPAPAREPAAAPEKAPAPRVAAVPAAPVAAPVQEESAEVLAGRRRTAAVRAARSAGLSVAGNEPEQGLSRARSIHD